MCGIYGIISPTLNNFINKSSIIQAGYSSKNRGPERTHIIDSNTFMLFFHRLAIMNTSPLADQPHVYTSCNETYYVICNGEIYNYETLSKLYLDNMPINDTSCIYPLFEAFNYDFVKLNKELNGEYSLAILKLVDDNITDLWLSTDTSSVRPLFVCSNNNTVVFSSLLKGISDTPNIDKTKTIRLNGGEYKHYIFEKDPKSFKKDPESFIKNETSAYYITNINKNGLLKPYTNIDELVTTINNTLYYAIETRLKGDRPIGCLLSGGLDSSIVAAIASMILKENGQTLKTFSIGIKDGTDLKYAKLVADFIGSDHTEILFTEEDGLNALEDVIKTTETYDITTIRASVPQYLLAKYISQNTNIKIILNGDGADECQMGYLYNFYSPSHIESHEDNMRLIDDIHLYDGLRVDRCLSRWGLEARLPYLDKNFVNLYKKIHPKLKMPFLKKESQPYRIEKWLIRHSIFIRYKDKLLPEEVLWRVKEAFSDAISKKERSWYYIIQEWINNKNIELETRDHCSPISKESMWYRTIFEQEFGKDTTHIIPKYWMPNWTNATDPSARTLTIYK